MRGHYFYGTASFVRSKGLQLESRGDAKNSSRTKDFMSLKFEK